MHRLPDVGAAAERERQIAHAPAHERPGQRRLDPPRSVDVGDGVRVVLFDPRGYGEDVGIEDDVLGREAGLLGQEFVRACADRHLAVGRIGLALFVERHHHDRRAVAADEPRFGEELRLAFLETDGVDDPLPLEVL